jgi:hypothetical protein
MSKILSTVLLVGKKKDRNIDKIKEESSKVITLNAPYQTISYTDIDLLYQQTSISRASHYTNSSWTCAAAAYH